MRFGNLLTGNLRLNNARNAKYFRHLSKCGFRASDVIYQTFGYQSFHDSPFRMNPSILGSPKVTLRLRNILVSDRIPRHKDTRKRLNIPNECFETTIVFDGVEKLHFDRVLQMKHPTVFQATLDRKGMVSELCIEVTDGVENMAQPGTLKISFRKITVEDITPKIEKAIGGHLREKALLHPLAHDPSYYALRFEQGRR